MKNPRLESPHPLFILGIRMCAQNMERFTCANRGACSSHQSPEREKTKRKNRNKKATRGSWPYYYEQERYERGSWPRYERSDRTQKKKQPERMPKHPPRSTARPGRPSHGMRPQRWREHKTSPSGVKAANSGTCWESPEIPP